MQRITIDHIYYYNIDITSKCNAGCPDCARTDLKTGKKLKELPLQDWSVENFKNIFNNKTLNKKCMVFNGVYGDALAHYDFLEIAEHCSRSTLENWKVHTNGALRSPDFFKDLADIQKTNKNTYTVFSIDGLEDTNHIYRRFCIWGKLMENIEAFIKAGGKAQWDFLVFDHNAHQIEDVKKLSKKLGFADIRIKHTNRNVFQDKSNDVYPSELNSAEQIRKKFSQKEDYNNWAKEQKITCFAHKHQQVDIGFDMKLWPCCWIYDKDYPRQKCNQELYDRYGENFNSLYYHSIEDVLNHTWFKEHLPMTIDNPKSKLTHIQCPNMCQNVFKVNKPQEKWVSYEAI